MKSNFVIFRPYQKRIDHEVSIKLFDYGKNSFTSLERKDYVAKSLLTHVAKTMRHLKYSILSYVKYLSIFIDSKRTWKHHISFISSKISRSLGILTRLRHFVPTGTLLSEYRSLTQSYITYRIAVWDETAQTNLGSWY